MMQYLCAIGIFLLIVGCTQTSTLTVHIVTPTQIIPFHVEVADDPDERATGLMFRETLASDAGMLFIFEDESPRSFWMKNTKIPLDILYAAANGTIIDIQTMQPCTTILCPSYPSNGSAQYVLEIPDGTASRLHIALGSVLVREQSFK